MNKLKNYLLATLGVAILFGALVLSSPSASNASQAPQDVKAAQTLSSKLERIPQAAREHASNLLRSPQAGLISGGGINALRLISGNVTSLQSLQTVQPENPAPYLPFESNNSQVMVLMQRIKGKREQARQELQSDSNR